MLFYVSEKLLERFKQCLILGNTNKLGPKSSLISKPFVPGLSTHTNMLLGTKEQAFEQEVNVRALKQCYREAREEIDELRLLLKEQNGQLQDYRVKV